MRKILIALLPLLLAGCVFVLQTYLAALLNPVTLNAMISAIAGSITTDAGLGQDQLLALADRLKGTNPNNVAFMTVPIAGDKRIHGLGDVLLWDQSRAAKLFDAIRTDTPVVRPVTTSPSPGVTVAPGNVSVKVFNGTTTAGLGRRAATDLAALGFGIDGPAANAPAPVGAPTVISYDPRWDQSAHTVAAAIPGSTLTAVQGLGRVIQVTVGTSYTGAQPVHLASAAPTPTSTLVRTRTAAQDLCS